MNKNDNSVDFLFGIVDSGRGCMRHLRCTVECAFANTAAVADVFVDTIIQSLLALARIRRQIGNVEEACKQDEVAEVHGNR